MHDGSAIFGLISLYYLTAGIMLSAAFTTGALCIVNSAAFTRELYLSLAILSLGGAVYQVASALYFSSATVDTAIAAMRYQIYGACLGLVGIFTFIGIYTGQKHLKPWLSVVMAYILIMAVANTLSPTTLRYDEIHGLHTVTLLWGETGQALSGERGILSATWNIGNLILLCWLVVRAHIAWRNQLRQLATVLLFYTVLQALAASFQLIVDQGNFDGVFVSGFVVTLLVLLGCVILALDAADQARLLQHRTNQLELEIDHRQRAETHVLMLSQVFRQSPISGHIIELDGTVLEVNAASKAFWKRELNQGRAVNLFDQLESLGIPHSRISAALRAGKSFASSPLRIPQERLAALSLTGGQRWVRVTAYPLRDAAAQIQRGVVRIEDISDQQYVTNAIKYIAQGVSSPAGTQFFNDLVINLQRLLETHFVFVGMVDKPNLPTAVHTLAVAEDGGLAPNFIYPLAGTPCENVLGERACAYSHRVRELFPKDTLLQDMGIEGYVGSPILDNSKRPIGLVVVLDTKPLSGTEQLLEVMDIFAARAGAEMMRVDAEKEMRRMAYEDYLTGLPNRAVTQEYLAKLLDAPGKDQFPSLLILADLDHFKTINDALGHDVGDEVIRALGRRLTRHYDHSAFVARFGGDEFVVVKTLTQSNIEAAAKTLAEELGQLLNRPVQVGDHILDVRATLGITELPGHAKTVIDTLRAAEIALYKAKEAGRGGYYLFEPDLQHAVDARLQIEKGLRRAIEENELLLYYQPQVDSDGRMVGAEALIRWNDPKRGMISPAHFIPVAEESGLIHRVGDWVLREAVRFLSSRRHFFSHREAHLSVNVSPWQFARPDFVDSVIQLFGQAHVEASLITLEVTETALLVDVEETREKLTLLREAGFTVALDDFGTGYSSLAYLKYLPLDILKIDKTFVDELAARRDHPLVESMVAIGRHMDLTVVAEGVETEQQLQCLRQMGCHAYQGFLIARPLPEADFDDWLRAHNRTFNSVYAARGSDAKG